MAFLDNSTTMLLTPTPASIGTTSVGGTTAVGRFVIKDNKGELEFDPKKVSTTCCVQNITCNVSFWSSLSCSALSRSAWVQFLCLCQ